ncbi:MAG: hypothetical protein HQK49_15690 [Oligoflexia bacterium]|nr:hypothetical protein [Oligoflexia bacterium]
MNEITLVRILFFYFLSSFIFTFTFTLIFTKEMSAFGGEEDSNPPATYGPEFTFHNKTTEYSQKGGPCAIGAACPATVIYQKNLAEIIKKECAKEEYRELSCAIEQDTTEYQDIVYNITFLDPKDLKIPKERKKLLIGPDIRVVEVNLSPVSLQQLIEKDSAYKKIIDLLFKATDEVKLEHSQVEELISSASERIPMKEDKTNAVKELNDSRTDHEKEKLRPGGGGGHIHIDFFNTFKKDYCKAIDFFIEMSNLGPFLDVGPCCCTGISGSQANLNLTKMKRILDSCTKDCSQKTTSNEKLKSTISCFDQIDRTVYDRSGILDTPPSNKYQHINLTKIVDGKKVNTKGGIAFENLSDNIVMNKNSTIEFRLFQGQKNYSDFLNQVQTLDAIINYCKEKKQPSSYQLNWNSYKECGYKYKQFVTIPQLPSEEMKQCNKAAIKCAAKVVSDFAKKIAKHNEDQNPRKKIALTADDMLNIVYFGCPDVKNNIAKELSLIKNEENKEKNLEDPSFKVCLPNTMKIFEQKKDIKEVLKILNEN